MSSAVPRRTSALGRLMQICSPVGAARLLCILLLQGFFISEVQAQGMVLRLRVSTNEVSVDEDGGTGTYRVVLTSQPTADVTVTPTSRDETVVTASGPLTFTPRNWDQPQIVTVTGVSDGIISEGDRNATISHSTRSTDSNYRELMSLGEVAVTVTDANGVSVMPTELSVLEGGQVTYTIRLNRQPTGDVMITPISNNPTVATVSGTLTFTTSNWNTLQRVAVVGINDNTVNNPGRTAIISHRISGGGYDDIAVPDVTVTTIDGVRVTVSQLSIFEGGRGTYAIRLNHQPNGNVMITPTSDDRSVATVSGTLTFTISNWNRHQRVAVTAVDDNALNNPGRT